MLLGGESISYRKPTRLIVTLSFSAVCLKNLNDHENAYLAFERSAILSDAIRNPLIYLNCAIYCIRTKRFDKAKSYLENLFKMLEHINVRNEVGRRRHAFTASWTKSSLSFSQYKKLAERLYQQLPNAVESTEQAEQLAEFEALQKLEAATAQEAPDQPDEAFKEMLVE